MYDCTSHFVHLAYRFTGKERDAESGNDYFEARYYTSTMGRFMSPDWSAQEEPVPYAHLDDPQSLNLYSYVLNNPLTKADLDGHGCPPDCSTGNDVVDFTGGAANAFTSDNTLGFGRNDQSTSAGKFGQAFGDFGAAVVGAGETLLSTGGELVGGALDATLVGAPAGVALNIVSAAGIVQGGAAAGEGFTNLLKDANSSSGSSGKAPKGDDGHPMELHHEGQNAEGPVKEMTRTDHRLGENFKKNHPNTGQEPSKIDRGKFKTIREQYWKNRDKKSQ